MKLALQWTLIGDACVFFVKDDLIIVGIRLSKQMHFQTRSKCNTKAIRHQGMDLAPVQISRDSSVPALRVNSSENRVKQDTALTSLFIL